MPNNFKFVEFSYAPPAQNSHNQEPRLRGRCSNKVMSRRPRNLVSILSSEKRLFFSIKRPDLYWAPPSAYSVGSGSSSQVTDAAGAWCWPLRTITFVYIPATITLKNKLTCKVMVVLLWCYNSSLNITACCRRTFPLVSCRHKPRLKNGSCPASAVLHLALQLQVNANGFFKT